MVSPEIVTLSVFITPWMNPTCIHRAISDACAVEHGVEERQRGHVGGGRRRVVAADRVVGEAGQERRVAVHRGVDEAADAEVAGRHAGEDRAGQVGVAGDPLAGADHRERTRGGDAERVHRHAHQVLAQHRTDRGLAVAAARERACAPSP